MTLEVGLLGYGYWGKNHLATLRDISKAHVRWVTDPISPPGVNSMPNGALYTPDYKTVFEDSQVEAVIISTPTNTHYALAREALERGKHVLVEKPFTKTTDEAKDLVRMSEQMGKILMVGHIFKFNPAVTFMKDFIDKPEFGRLRYIDARRVNPGPIRKDVNALWDLGSHDIYIVTHLIGGEPRRVSYQGTTFNGQVDDISTLTMKFDDGIIATVHSNWIHPVKERSFIVGGERQAISFTDTEPAQKIRIDNIGADFQPAEGGIGPFQAAITSGDTLLPKLPSAQPLREELEHFIASINGEVSCISDAYEGLTNVRILEAAERSRMQGGLEVSIEK